MVMSSMKGRCGSKSSGRSPANSANSSRPPTQTTWSSSSWQTHAGRGVPQYRSRDRAQSTLFSNHSPKRLSPTSGGSQPIFRFWLSISSFRVVVAATDSIKSLALVSNGGQTTDLDASGTEADVRGMLPPPPESGWCYYFVKVVQVDDEVAWSSPIWLDAPDPA